MQNIRTYILGPSLIFPYFSSTIPILKALISHNERFFYLLYLILLISIICIICYVYLKRNNTLLIYTISLILIVSAFTLQRIYEARQSILLKESIFSKNQNINFEREILEININEKKTENENEYLKTFNSFKINLKNIFEEKNNLDISIKKYFINLELKNKEIMELINKLNDNWNQFLKESENISKELKALDISIELYNLELQEFLQNINLKYKILTEPDLQNILIQNSNTKLFISENNYQNPIFNIDNSILNNRNNNIILYLNFLIFIFISQLIICFIAFFLDSNNERILFWIRSSLFFLCILELISGLICMIYAHSAEKLCLTHDLNICKSNSSYRMDDIINIIKVNKNESLNLFNNQRNSKLIINKQILKDKQIIEPLTNTQLLTNWFTDFHLSNFLSFVLSPNYNKKEIINKTEKNININNFQQIKFIEKEFETHREKIQKTIILLKKIIENELKDKLIGKEILFDSLFDKIKYLEPDFNNLMGNQINKENYYNIIQTLKTEISSIILISNQNSFDLLNNLIKYVKMDEFFNNSIDSLKMYITGSSILNQETFKVENEKCNHSIRLICNGANRLNEIFLIMMIFGICFSFMLCF